MKSLLVLLLTLIAISALNARVVSFVDTKEANLKAKDCSVNSEGYVYYIGTDNKVYYYDEIEGKSKMIKGSKVTNGSGLGVDKYRNVYTCGKDKRVWKFSASGNDPLTGKWESLANICCTDLDSNSKGNIVISECNTLRVYVWNSSEKKFVYRTAGPDKVAIREDSYTLGCRFNYYRYFYLFYPSGSARRSIKYGAREVSVDTSLQTWILDNSLYLRSGGSDPSHVNHFGRHLTRQFTRMAVGPTDKICAVSTTNSILHVYRF